MNRGIVLATIVVAVIIAVAWVASRSRRPRVGEVAPAGVLQEKYGLYAENRPVIKLNPDRVPVQLRDLIPLAEKWGVGDDIIRGDLIDKASDAERRELVNALKDRYEQISSWLDSVGADQMTDEMAAFMYLMEASEEARTLVK